MAFLTEYGVKKRLVKKVKGLLQPLQTSICIWRWWCSMYCRIGRTLWITSFFKSVVEFRQMFQNGPIKGSKQWKVSRIGKSEGNHPLSCLSLQIWQKWIQHGWNVLLDLLYSPGNELPDYHLFGSLLFEWDELQFYGTI